MKPSMTTKLNILNCFQIKQEEESDIHRCTAEKGCVNGTVNNAILGEVGTRECLVSKSANKIFLYLMGNLKHSSVRAVAQVGRNRYLMKYMLNFIGRSKEFIEKHHFNTCKDHFLVCPACIHQEIHTGPRRIRSYREVIKINGQNAVSKYCRIHNQGTSVCPVCNYYRMNTGTMNSYREIINTRGRDLVITKFCKMHNYHNSEINQSVLLYFKQKEIQTRQNRLNERNRENVMNGDREFNEQNIGVNNEDRNLMI